MSSESSKFAGSDISGAQDRSMYCMWNEPSGFGVAGPKVVVVSRGSLIKWPLILEEG
jgi:hypothetical protein